MKVLALSDLFWDWDSRGIPLEKVKNMTESEILGEPLFEPVLNYFLTVIEQKPDIVLLCGDITGDAGITGYTSSLYAFLKLLELKKFQVRFISGNHDEDKYFLPIVAEFSKSKWIKHLDNKIENINGLKVMGLSYFHTYTKTNFKKVIIKDKIDILFCHCPHTFRLNLFKFNVNTIITGHYDNKVICPNGKLFISLSNDGSNRLNYATINILKNGRTIEYFFEDIPKDRVLKLRFKRNKRKLNLKEEPIDLSSNLKIEEIYNSNYEQVVEEVLNSEEKYSENSKIANLAGTRIGYAEFVSHTFLKAYIYD